MGGDESGEDDPWGPDDIHPIGFPVSRPPAPPASPFANQTNLVPVELFETWLLPKHALASFGRPNDPAIMRAFMNRLKVGRIVAAAETTTISTDEGQDEPLLYQVVPARLWAFPTYSDPGALWTVGDETFETAVDRYQQDSGDNWIALTGVRFAPEGVEALKKAFGIDAAAPLDAPISVGGSQSPRGRKAASWWPAFAEELASYVHDDGLPEGTGSDGQGDMIKTILQRLSDRGFDASRTTIQPVIQAVLRRLRAAGK